MCGYPEALDRQGQTLVHHCFPSELRTLGVKGTKDTMLKTNHHFYELLWLLSRHCDLGRNENVIWVEK